MGVKLYNFLMSLFLVVTGSHALAFYSGVLFFVTIEIVGSEKLISFLSHWQTLVSGILAVIAALGTIYMMHKNHEDLIRRSNLAAKAHMHDVASDLCEYCRNCLAYVEQNRTNLPDKISDIDVLKSHIGYLDNATAEFVSELLYFYQVNHARLKGYTPGRTDNIFHIDEHRHYIVLVHFYATRLFKLARREIDSISHQEPTRSEMHNSLNNLITVHDWDSQKYESLRNVLNNYYSE